MVMSSRIRSNVPIGIAAIAGLLVAAGPAGTQAAQAVQDQKLHVQAFIGQLCTVTSAALDFGNGINTAVGAQATGAIEINCASPTDVSIDLNGGLRPGAEATRAMQGDGPDLGYILYKTGFSVDPWIPGQPLTTNIGSSDSVPVYGVIPGQSDGRTGLFTDEVTITLSF
jgi:spore coat protein U domain-containing protein, fimbrial subunit CupE1/2/3/6